MRLRDRVALVLIAASLAGGVAAWAGPSDPPHNVVIFVADGLRYAVVTPDSAPAIAAVRDQGVDFTNSHSLYPTVTTPNASAIATGHRLGDTGDFGNSIYLGEPALAQASGALAPTFEDDTIIAGANARFGGNYLGETSLLAAARARGYSTAAIGKLGPTHIQDVTAQADAHAIVIDDSTGTAKGVPLAPEIVEAIKAAGLPALPPTRGLNGETGGFIRPGTTVANAGQQDWFTAVATKVLLPRFKAADRPFVLVFWSRDPDGTQHNQGDSLNSLTPGINGPTSMAAIRNASDDLQRLRDALKALGLDRTTDIIVTADHGFSTISKQSPGSYAATLPYTDVPKGFLPPGFLAIDLGHALGLALYDQDGTAIAPAGGAHPRKGSAILGADPMHPDVVIGANGGSDLIWLPKAGAPALARRIAAFLTAQDYTGALFVDDTLGPVPGALPFSAIGLKGSARTPVPAMIVGFRSASTGCARPELCGVDISDTELQQGQGTHGSFGRADTRNFMAAVGPDFRVGFDDPAPVSNADLAPTAARIMGLDLGGRGTERGRVLREALKGGRPVASTRHVLRSAAAANGFRTVLRFQRAGGAPYFDTAGAPGRTLQSGAPDTARHQARAVTKPYP